MAGRKVLVVDDDKYVCDVVKLMLEKKGCEAVIISDGEATVENAEAEKPDLILLDITLHDISGFKVLERLKNNPTTEKIPVVMMTGREDYASMARARGLMADDYLTKPFLSDELFEKISKYFK
ncbi:MAG: response regulator [Candidatus Omnitrophota bacterium]